MKRLMILVWLLGTGIHALAVGFAQDKDGERDRFQRAWYLEMGEGRLEDAITLYRALEGDEAVGEETRARAMFRLGVCLAKTGSDDEAQAMFRRVVEEYAHLPDIAREATLRLDGETEEQARTRKRVEALVPLLRTEDTRKEASKALSRLGSSAFPYVLAKLRTSDGTTSQRLAHVLFEWTWADPNLLPIIIAELRTDDTVVRDALLASVQKGWGSQSAAMLAQETMPDIRRAVAIQLRSGRKTPEKMFLLEQLARDEIASVRIEAYHSLLIQSGTPKWTLAAADSNEDRVKRLAIDSMHVLPTDPSFGQFWNKQLEMLGGEPRSYWDALLHNLERAQRRLKSGLSILPDSDLGNRATSSIVNHLIQDPSSPHAIQVVSLLTAAGRSEVVDALRVMVESSELRWSLDLTLAVVRAVQEFRPQDFVPPLVSLLVRSTAPAIQEQIYNCLSANFHSSLSALVDELPNLSDEIASRICGVVRVSGNPRLGKRCLSFFSRLGPRSRQSVIEIAKADGGDVRDVYRMALSDPVDDIRLAALTALRQKPDPELLAPLMACLQDKRFPIVSAAAAALVELEDPESFPALVDSLYVSDSNIASNVASSILHAGNPVLTQLALQHIGDVSPQVASTMLNLLRSNRSFPWLETPISIDLDWLAEQNTRIRNWGIQVVGRQLLPEQADTIGRFLDDPSSDVRGSVVSALASLGSESTVPLLVRALSDTESSIRLHAAEGLVKAGSENARRALLSHLAGRPAKDLDIEIVSIAGQFRDPRFAPILVDRFCEPQPGSQDQGLVTLLAELPDGKGIPFLIEVVEESRVPNDQWLAIRALARTDSHETQDALRNLLESEDCLVQGYAAEQLSRFPSRENAALILPLLQSPADRTRGDAKGALERIRFYFEQRDFVELKTKSPNAAIHEFERQLQNPEPSVRAAAARSLGRLGDLSALKALVRARHDQDAGVRAAVEAALDTLTSD